MRILIVLLLLLCLPAHADDVSPANAESLLKDRKLCIVDMRDATAYLKGHVLGAVHLPEKTLIPFPDAEAFARLMGGLGIGDDTMVLIYDDSGGTRAARLWAVLTAYGHDRAKVLPFGFAGWAMERWPCTDVPAEPEPMTFTPRPADLIWTRADVLGRAPDVVVLDVRSPEEFSGAKRSPGTMKAGRILGAINIDDALTTCTVAGEKTLESEEVLKRLYGSLPRDRPILVYCSSGGRAAHTTFLLKNLGYTNVRLYYASFADYTRSSIAPIGRD